jgi:hypothetical protein
MRQVAAALLFALLMGCAEGQQERVPPRPLWFQRTDFVRPGHVSTWDCDNPPVSVCGQVLGTILTGLAGR